MGLPSLDVAASTSTTQTTTQNQQGANINTGISFAAQAAPTYPVNILTPGVPVSTFSFSQWTQSGTGLIVMISAIVLGGILVLAGAVKFLRGKRK